VSKAPSLVKETDIKRACRGVRAAGLQIQRVEIEKMTGNIVIVPGLPGEKPVDLAVNEWDGTA